MAKRKTVESTTAPVGKADAYQLLRDTLQKAHGDFALIQLKPSELETSFTGDTVSTGSLSLDLALKHPIPRGRIIEIYGPEASGKTTLALHILAEAQKAYPDKRVACLDVEHALDLDYAKTIGIDLENFDLSQPDSAEQALDIAEALARSGLYSVILADSVAAMVPEAEQEGGMGDQQMGLHARLMSKAMRKLTGPLSKTNTTLIAINQIRMKIGVMFGNPETTTGGNALKYYSSQRLDIRRSEILKDGENPYGQRSRIKVVKNKVAAPYKEVEVDIIFGKGFDVFSDIVDKASEMGVIEKSGSWYSYKDERIGQGKESAISFLKERPEVTKQIREQILVLHTQSLT